MAEPTINLGNGNWAGKSGNTLGYYKEGERFYKQDFTFSRSTTGTYTDSDGYIQEMPYNLASYSEEFNNAAYSLTESSITANAINSPIGTLTADKLVENTLNNLHRVGQGSISVINGEVYTFSFYVKAAERNELELQRINTSGTVFNSISVTTANLTNGTLSVGSNVTASSIENVGNDWYRISISLTAIANGSGGLNIGMQINGSFFYQGDGVSGVYLWGFQAVKGSSAKTYFPTTTRLNMPRVDYLNNSKGSLILEPQRSNLVTYSSDFSHSSYIRNQTTATTGFISPDGNLNAYKLLEDNTNNIHRIYQTATVTGSPNTTISVYVKYLGRKNVLMRIADSTVGRWYDIENGVLGGIYQGAPDNSSIEYVSNGWYRISITHTVSNQCRLELWVSNTESTSAYQGDTTKGVYLFGAQLEVGSYPTSYIPTSGSSVTRSRDLCDTQNLSHVIGQTEGVIFYDAILVHKSTSTSEDLFELSIDDGTNQNIFFINNYNNTLTVSLLNGGSSQFYNNSYNPTEGARYKLAFAYKQNDFALYINGNQIATDSSGTVPTLNQITFGNYYNNQLNLANSVKVNDFKLYNTRLSNSELAELTTL